MTIEEVKLDALLARIGYQRGSGTGNSLEVWVVYYSRTLKANHECFIGIVNDIVRLTDHAVKQLIAEKTEEVDRQIIPSIEPL